MLATADHTTLRAVVAAERALASANASVDPVPVLAMQSASRAVRRMLSSTTDRTIVQTQWKKRPADWKPYPSWDEAMAAWVAARQATSDAFKACRTLSTPFINDPANAGIRDAYIFSRTIDEAVAKRPDLPADLVAASRAHEEARAHQEHVRRRATQTPANGLNILAKMRMITEYIDDVFDPLDADDVRQAHKRPDEFPMTNEFFALHDDIIRAVDDGNADGEMLAMSRELARRFALEMSETDDSKVDDAIEHSGAIAYAIMERPARTVADLRAKAEVVQWACNGREDLDAAFGGTPGSSYMMFAHRLLSELLDGTPEAPYLRLDRRTDPWAEKLDERSRSVEWVNAMVETLPPDIDDTAYFKRDLARQAELEAEIVAGPFHDPQARAAQIRLCLKQDAEGFDMGARALDLLKQLEATLPPAPGLVVQ